MVYFDEKFYADGRVQVTLVSSFFGLPSSHGCLASNGESKALHAMTRLDLHTPLSPRVPPRPLPPQLDI